MDVEKKPHNGSLFFTAHRATLRFSRDQLDQAAQEPMLICLDHHVQSLIRLLAELADIADRVGKGLDRLVPLVTLHFAQFL